MRDRRVRVAFVGLILTFPMLMATTAGRSSDLSTLKTVLGVTATLAAGLLLAAKGRRDLHATAEADIATAPALAFARPRIMRGSAARLIPAGARRPPE